MLGVSNVDETAQGLRAYGGESGDARVARRRTALIDATLDMLAEPEPGAVTVRGICARASLTPRYFYESFAGADALVEATYDLIIGEIAERALAGFDAGSSPRGKVVGAVEAIVDVIESDPRKGRVMFSDTLRSPVIATKRAEMITLFTNLTFQSAPAVAKVSGGQETLAAAHFQVGGLGRVLASWTEGLIDLDRSALVSICVQMLLPESRAVGPSEAKLS
ncbi:TetR/AcrR family transcriptional regulator [Gordonia sp. (in: high G+C Gram-positive bacteria)]|uniref:TetR/AcrR family transcriptional regulator n=1 Tax=Gordonia sp. (in: high G+C Gram-positive bacteria) TaxID=84139 RepID=UPI0016B68204|nr:TetR/AcrR family transcriptional regulator [Gordonia sp. (in: high G+C Gram-positive bacteria)]NLG45441.1 TetR/AcrR family transcriptional regulator [Gordonia sp. (in: high G+C Gram-positive bacteria)]